MSEQIDPQKLREVLHYDPTTGIFVWRKTLSPKAPAGSRAGSVGANGYRVIRLYGMAYRAHRLAWLYATNAMPTHTIDHINGARDDNRIDNLRDVPSHVNAQNVRHTKGFIFDKRTGRWYAQLTINGRKTHIGSFADPVSAREAYLTAKRAIHDGCTI